MAASAIEALTRRGSWWHTVLYPTPGRVELALRITVICSLAVVVTQVYETPEPAITAYIVFFLNRDNRVTNVVIGLALCVLAALLVGLLMLLAREVADDPLWRVTSIALISMTLLFLTSASKLRPLASTLALVIGYGLDALSLIQVGEEATRGLLYAWLMVAVAAGTSVVVNLLMAPAPRRLAERALAERLRVCAALLRDPDDPARQELRHFMDEGTSETLQHLRLSAVDGIAAPDLAALRQAVVSSWRLLSALDVLDSATAASLPAPWRENTARTMQEMAELLEKGRYPLEVQVEEPPSLAPPARQLAAEIRDVMMHFAEGGPAAAPARHSGGGFFLPDAFSNPAHYRFALRTTAAALFCYAFYTVTDWSGIHTCFLTCYIVSLGTTAESVEKLLLRVVGCLIGAAAGIATIVYLVPAASSIAGLLLIVFPLTLVASYIAAGGPRISYAGFQIAFAFFLCILQGSGPSLDLTVARDRVVGILIGIVVAYVALSRLWPTSIAERIDPELAQQLRLLSRLLPLPDVQERRALAAQARAGLAAVATDIELAHFEPLSRPSDAWLASRRTAVTEAAALGSLLLVGCEQTAGLSKNIEARLRGVADGLEAGTGAPPSAMSRPTQPPSLQTLVDARLQGMEEALTTGLNGQEDLRAAS